MQILLRARGALAAEERADLIHLGHDALPAVEEGLAGGPPSDVRRELVGLLDRIGDGDAVPILQQEVAYGPDAATRADATAVLERWASASDGRAAAARVALQRAAALRALERVNEAAR